jgi:methionyl-tRNA formyltransferase
MRIVFIGTVDFSESSLRKLVQIKSKPVGVCTSKDLRSNSDYVNLLPFCKKNNIPTHLTNNINSKKTLKWIKGCKPDIIFCFGWSRLLKTEILSTAPMGVIGYHPSALPKNRGRHPIIWSLVLGLKETASSFFFMDKGADSGDILSQKKINISKNDNAQTLYSKLIYTSLEQIETFIPQLISGKYERIVQDNKEANTWRKRRIEDGKIDWRMPASLIDNLVRGLSKPYVGAHFSINDKEYKVWDTEVITNSKINIEPGKIIFLENNIPIIKTGIDSIKLLDVEPFLKFELGKFI